MIVQKKDFVPFLCKATGRCCIHNLVILSSFDIFRIAKELNLSAKELFEQKILTYRINPASYWMEPIINSRSNSACPFLFKELDSDDKTYLCKIYDSRPLVCRVYPLKYDKDADLFLRFLPAEHRCFECISNENNPTLEEYLNNSNVNELLSEFQKYLILVEKIIQTGYTIKNIKKNKSAQNRFFKIQSILYETYPEKVNPNEALPFLEIEKQVLDILEEQNSN